MCPFNPEADFSSTDRKNVCPFIEPRAHIFVDIVSANLLVTKWVSFLNDDSLVVLLG